MKFNVADFAPSTSIRTIEFNPEASQMSVQFTTSEKQYVYNIQPTDFVTAEDSTRLIQETVQNRLENLKDGADPDSYSVGKYVNSLIREKLIQLA